VREGDWSLRDPLKYGPSSNTRKLSAMLTTTMEGTAVGEAVTPPWKEIQPSAVHSRSCYPDTKKT